MIQAKRVWNKKPKKGIGWAKFSRNRVNFKKYTGGETKKWSEGMKKAHSCRYTLDHKLLAWKCDPNCHDGFGNWGCGKYKEEERKTALDFLKELGFIENQQEYNEALTYKIPLFMNNSCFSVKQKRLT